MVSFLQSGGGMADAEVRRERLSMLVSGLITLSNGLNNLHQLL
jgi:hypothetical protein